MTKNWSVQNISGVCKSSGDGASKNTCTKLIEMVNKTEVAEKRER